MNDSISGILYDCDGRPRKFWTRLQVVALLAVLAFGWAIAGFVVGDTLATTREQRRAVEAYGLKLDLAGRVISEASGATVEAANATATAAAAVEAAQATKTEKPKK